MPRCMARRTASTANSGLPARYDLRREDKGRNTLQTAGALHLVALQVARRLIDWPYDRGRQGPGSDKRQEGRQAEEGETVVMDVQLCPTFLIVAGIRTHGYPRIHQGSFGDSDYPKSCNGKVSVRVQ